MNDTGAALDAGDVVQSPIPDATQITLADTLIGPATYPIGTKVFTIVIGATNAITLNQYAGGFLVVDDGTGVGVKMRIASHPASAKSLPVVFTCVDATPVALDSTSTFTLIPNPFAGVIATAAPPTAKVLGVAPCAVPKGDFFWLQTKGPAVVTSTAAVTSGRNGPGQFHRWYQCRG